MNARGSACRLILRLAVIAAACLAVVGPVAHAQVAARCGVVDGIDYPIDISDTLERRFDDFGRFRSRFGGLHVGIDLGFRRLGEPVFAAARGRVTYADPEGWDTEKGVVIVEHILPEGAIFYTLYGHMEESDTVRFPPVDSCVERGQTVGNIGWPSLGLPHLHYEIRDFMPDDGGPGYVSENPARLGWHHPLDFTAMLRLRLNPAFLDGLTFPEVPDVAPALLDSDVVVYAAGPTLIGAYPPETQLWQLTTDSPVIGLAALPEDRVVAYTRGGQVITLQSGRYRALWQVDGPRSPFAVAGETLVFRTADGLAAYDPAGTLLWTLPTASLNDERITQIEGHGETLAVTTLGRNGYGWRLIDRDGQVRYQTTLGRSPVAAPGPNGSWFLLDGSNLTRVAGGERSVIASLGQTHGRAARLTVDLLGNSFIYLADADRTLLAVGLAGEPRWRVSYPGTDGIIAPLLDTGNGCMLYALDADGTLHVFSTEDGRLLNQVALYPGGDQTGQPGARLLLADSTERVIVGAGFRSLAVLDGRVLGGERAATCLLG